MSDALCEICGRPLCVAQLMGGYEEQRKCYRLGYERTLARADRYQAEFAACKALLIAEQKRAERAEAERAEARAALERIERNEPNGIAIVARALAALPVEPAQADEPCNTRSADGAHVCTEPSGHCGAIGWHSDGTHRWAQCVEVALAGGPPKIVQKPAELARCSDQPAPQNPPPSPTGDT